MSATYLTHATQEAESVLPLTNDQRIAAWAVKFFGNGHHHRREKPRIRVTVPAPLPHTTPGDPGKDSK